LKSLKNREHPYRQVLDISSAGRTQIVEKTERFTKQDVEENLVVLVMMLPSANRRNKEVLKVFKDSGGYTDFFPSEDDWINNKNLLKSFPNLDCFEEEDVFGAKIVKTSLGNVIRLLQPMIIIDEGHKAYTASAKSTIENFNPSLILELSATPPKGSNILVNISGQELNREEMIKLDMHIVNKTTTDWKEVMLASIRKRNCLEDKAKEYYSSTGENIRPISLIQVERTGKNQRSSKYIHAEDVKEYLIQQCKIPSDEIAIKSSEKDDIEGIDLMDKDCPIRYIITKQALQEGWDCAFAYILTILTNPGSQVSITQLVGRILRQPYARKTNILELDESYVYCFRQNAKNLLSNVKKGFEEEGLGDIYKRISFKEDNEEIDETKERKVRYRTHFQKFEGKIYLPKFVIQEEDRWRDVNFEIDILSKIDWDKIEIDPMKHLTLSSLEPKEQEITVGLSTNRNKVIRVSDNVSINGGLDVDALFITRHIVDVVPNPWVAYEITNKLLNTIYEKYKDKKIVANNIIFIIEELKKLLIKERDQLAEAIFKDMINKKSICFFLLSDKGAYELPSSITFRKNVNILVRNDNTQIQKSLFDFVPEDDLNQLEQSVAIYLDEQEKLLWWYRNISRQNYFLQGWKKNKIYPDFVFTKQDEQNADDYGNVFVIETKGVHLKNEDTDYKKNVFDLCNKIGSKKEWKEINSEFGEKGIEFQVIFEDEWKQRIHEIFG
jgi:type III restriction enzyme